MAEKNMETLKNENMNLADKIYIFDTTLRDGEQTPGVALTVDEKIQISRKLNNLGVDKICSTKYRLSKFTDIKPTHE